MIRKKRMAIDLAMTALIPMLMAYSLIRETFHEIAGTIMVFLFLAHHWLNRKWWTGLFKGSWPVARVLRTALNLILFLFMILQPVTGILISKHLYSFVQVEGATATARELHLACAYWFMVLMCIHAGSHLGVPLKRLKRKSRKAFTVLAMIAGLISIYGMYAFVQRSFPDYMSLQQKFAFIDPDQSKVVFFMDYLAVMMLFAAVGYIIDRILVNINRKGRG